MKPFIYTNKEETYEALKLLGFTDAGYVEGGGSVTYVLIDTTGELQIPKEYEKSCVRNATMFMSPLKGGDDHERRITKNTTAANTV